MDKDVIIVTGSCGRIGASLVKVLGQKYRIVGFELLKALYASANEELVPVDISSDESVQQALNHIQHFYGKKIASVIHLAAYYSFSQKQSPLYDSITVRGTERLLKGLQNFEVEQFLFSSSMLVYPPCRLDEKINEEWPLRAKWAYPESKVRTEELIHKERKKIPTVILRIAGVYDDRCHSIPISHQIQRIYENQLTSHFFPGNLKSGASFLHMDDLVDSIVMAVEKRSVLPEETILNIGEPKTLSYDELQRKISLLLKGKETTTYRIPQLLAMIGAFAQEHIPFAPKPFIRPWMIPLADDNYILDISRAKHLLGWEPKHSLEESLPKMIDALKKDPKRWYKENGLK